MVEHKAIRLLSDAPLPRGSRFNFDRISESLASLIVASPSSVPLNICVSGSWGTGKTTVLRTLQTLLDERSQGTGKFIPAWFEPWKLSGEDQVRVGLVKMILNLVQSDAPFLSGARIELDRGNVVRVLSERLFGSGADTVSTSLHWDALSRGTFVEVEELFRRIAESYLCEKDHPRRIVVLVDDLDRCRPDRVVETLESVKLFFDLPGLVFVFALDREQVEKSITTHYPGLRSDHARTYLSKIFQLTFPLPRKDVASLVEFVRGALHDVGLEIDSQELAAALVSRFGRNLRNLKLFINACAFQASVIGGPAREIDSEVLLKWLYLESSMPASLEIAAQEGSLNLVTALELVAYGGGLVFSPDEMSHYGSTDSGGLDWVAAILTALVAESEGDEAAASLPVNGREAAVSRALRVDGVLAPSLTVLREGATRLAHQDLPRLAFLTRSEDLSVTVSQAGEGVDGVPSANAGVQSSKPWETAGDTFYGRGRHRAAYLCYLQALRLDDTLAVNWMDLARAARQIGRLRSCGAFLREALRCDEKSANVWIEMANLFDFALADKATGSLAYRRVLGIGAGTAVTPYNLALNLDRIGDYETAYYCCLKACSMDHEDTKKFVKLADLGSKIDKTGLNYDSWNAELQAELNSAVKHGLYPPPMSEAEEKALAEVVAGLPTLEAARDELSRLPV